MGQRSPLGFRRHQIDVVALRTLLLDPLGPGGLRHFHTTSYDVHSSSPNLSAEFVAEPNDVLLFDGLFIHAPALTDCFALTIYVSAAFETCLARALARNQERATDMDELEAIYRQRYIPGFELYCQEVAPDRRATIVVKT